MLEPEHTALTQVEVVYHLELGLSIVSVDLRMQLGDQVLLLTLLWLHASAPVHLD